MTTTTPNMSLVLPALNSDPGVWDTYNNNALTIVDAHTHAAGSGVLIRPNAIGINADLTFAGYSATNLRAAVFTAQASFATALAIYVKTNDLYFRDGASNEVRLTASGALNIATTGGIAGDYIAASAQVYYDDANKTYRFLEAAPPNNWSYIACGGADLYQQGLGITNRVRLSSPNALAASYEVTWPAALPGSTLLTQVSAAGVMTWSNTIANAVAMSSTLTVGSTLGVTGLITASAGVTAGAGQHITVSAGGLFKHGTTLRAVSPMAGKETLGGTNIQFTAGKAAWVGGASTLVIELPVDQGANFKSCVMRYKGDAAKTLTYSLDVYDGSSAVVTNLAGAALGVIAAVWGTNTIYGGTRLLALGEYVVLTVTWSGAGPEYGSTTYGFDQT